MVREEIATAAVTGLAAGGLASLIAPWAAWGIEKRRLRIVNRKDRIVEWRKGLGDLRRAETLDGVPVTQTVNDPGSLAVRPQTRQVVPDPDLVDVTTKEWFATLKPELPKCAKKKVEQLAQQPLSQRKGVMVDYLADQITRIETQKWKLV